MNELNILKNKKVFYCGWEKDIPKDVNKFGVLYIVNKLSNGNILLYDKVVSLITENYSEIEISKKINLLTS